MSSVFTAISFILSVALFAVARRGVPRPAGEFGADAPSRGAFLVDFFTGVVFGLFFDASFTGVARFPAMPSRERRSR